MAYRQELVKIKNLKDIRKSLMLSRAELSKSIGCSYMTIDRAGASGVTMTIGRKIVTGLIDLGIPKAEIEVVHI